MLLWADWRNFRIQESKKYWDGPRSSSGLHITSSKFHLVGVHATREPWSTRLYRGDYFAELLPVNRRSRWILSMKYVTRRVSLESWKDCLYTPNVRNTLSGAGRREWEIWWGDLWGYSEQILCYAGRNLGLPRAMSSEACKASEKDAADIVRNWLIGKSPESRWLTTDAHFDEA